MTNIFEFPKPLPKLAVDPDMPVPDPEICAGRLSQACAQSTPLGTILIITGVHTPKQLRALSKWLADCAEFAETRDNDAV